MYTTTRCELRVISPSNAPRHGASNMTDAPNAGRGAIPDRSSMRSSTNGKIISPTTPSRRSPTQSTNSRRCPTRGAGDRCLLTASRTSSCIVPGNDLRSQAMSSYVQQQIRAGTIGFVSWQHSPHAWERELLARGGGMHVLGAGAWSCSRFQRAGALLSFPLNAFVLNCAAKARRCDRAGGPPYSQSSANTAGREFWQRPSISRPIGS